MTAFGALSRAAQRPPADGTGLVVLTTDHLLFDAVPQKKRALGDKCHPGHMLHGKPCQNLLRVVLHGLRNQKAVVHQRVAF